MSHDILCELCWFGGTDGGTTIYRYAYTYDDQDLRSSEARTNAGKGLSFKDSFTSHDINALNQVLGSTGPDQVYAYDADGNMVRGYTPEGYAFTAAYDAENRLTSLEYIDSAGALRRTEHSYTGMGALAVAKTFENGTPVDETRVVRNGFLALQERDGTDNVRSEYTWGLDIAGGIGGLLNLRQGGQDYSYLYDGRGNVSALIDGTQAVVATCTYDAFGNLLAKTGTLDQPYRFSTKEYNEKTGLAYYGYRFYSPALGRWLTRDPLGERGGINLYGFVRNDPVNLIDPDGLDWWPGPRGPIPHRHRGKCNREVVNPTDPGAWPGHPAHENPDYYPRPLPEDLKDLVQDIAIPTAEKIAESRGWSVAKQFFRRIGPWTDFLFPRSLSERQ